MTHVGSVHVLYHENIEWVHTVILNNRVPIEEVVAHMYISHGSAHEVIHNRLDSK